MRRYHETFRLWEYLLFAVVTLADAHAALLRGETLSPAVLLPGENGGIILAG